MLLCRIYLESSIRLSQKAKPLTNISTVRLVIFAVLYIGTNITLIKAQQLECRKGSLSISLKDTPGSFLKINCSLHAVTAQVAEDTKEKCFSVDGNLKNIVSRSQWNANQDKRPSDARTKPADYVIVDGYSYVFDGDDFPSKMRSDQEYQNKEFGSMLKNFHIADNGVVYEALGWDKVYLIRSGGLNALIIAFVKKSSDDIPSQSAINSYKALVNTAICLGKLKHNYRLIPSHYIFHNNIMKENSFEIGELKNWDNYHSDTDLGVREETFGDFPVVFKQDWVAKTTKVKFSNLSLPIETIVISNYDERCFTVANCMRIVQWKQDYWIERDSDLLANFFIGDDGMAYEILGWDYSWHQHWVDKDAILIRFLGRYNTYLPSNRAFKAMRKLLRLGVMWGKLSPNYKIVSYRQRDGDIQYIGERLHEEIRKMKRFSDVSGLI